MLSGGGRFFYRHAEPRPATRDSNSILIPKVPGLRIEYAAHQNTQLTAQYSTNLCFPASERKSGHLPAARGNRGCSYRNPLQIREFIATSQVPDIRPSPASCFRSSRIRFRIPAATLVTRRHRSDSWYRTSATRGTRCFRAFLCIVISNAVGKLFVSI